MFNKLISSNLLKDWKTFSVFAGVSYGASQLLRKYLFIDNCDFYDVVIMFMIFYCSFLILSIFVICYIKKRSIFPVEKNSKKLKKILIITFVSAFLVIIGLWCKNKAFFLDNNVRVETVTQPAKIIFMFLISVMFLSAKWSKNTILGMIFGFLAIYFMAKD